MEILLQKKISIKLKDTIHFDKYEATIIIYRRRAGLLARIFEEREYTFRYKIFDNRLNRKNLNSREEDFNNLCDSKYKELSLHCEAIIEEYKKGIRPIKPIELMPRESSQMSNYQNLHNEKL